MIKEKSEANLKQLRHLEGSLTGFWSILKECNVIIAGGAIRSIFAGEKIKDFDLYFRCKEDSDRLLKHEKFKNVSQFVTHNAVSIRLEGKTFQLITLLYGEPEALINQFDFTVCQAGYDINNKTWYFHDNFFKHLAGRSLVFNNTLPYPLATLYRAFKYQKKGYNISPSEIIKLSIQCQALQVSSIFEWKTHLMGIDTIVLTAMFKQLEKDPPTDKVDAQFMMNYINEFLSSKHEDENDEE